MPAMNDLCHVYRDAMRAAAALGKCETDMVYGEGDPCARIMLIGEAPGAEETRLSRPFVGRAGRNLDAFLVVLGLRREELYITNVVKFRPCRISAKGTAKNRPPARAEIRCMLPFLLREIAAVRPAVVVTLGNTPLQGLLGKNAVIGACHAVPAAASALAHRFVLFPLYHPASVIYNRSLQGVYDQDLEKLKAFIRSGDVSLGK